MYPTDTDFTVTDTCSDQNGTVGASVVFDYQSGRFAIIDGAPQECSGVTAVKQWIDLLLRTRPGKYKVYGDTSFGISFDELIGSRSLPEGFIWSEVKREVLEGLALNPAIDTADSFALSRDGDRLTISFTVYLKTGETTEVSTVV